MRLYCLDCHRFAQYRKTTLMERFGGEIHGHTLLVTLKPCDRRTEGVALLGPTEPEGAD